MKKSFILTVLFCIATLNVLAQSSQIVASAYKEIYRHNGVWEKWPTYWTTYQSEGRSKPIFRITRIRKNSYYRIQMFINNKEKSDFYVRYDAQYTSQKRKNWGEEYVNCHRDHYGDYIYTQKVSLNSLVNDPHAWASNKDSKLYIWVFSQDHAVVVK